MLISRFAPKTVTPLPYSRTEDEHADEASGVLLLPLELLFTREYIFGERKGVNDEFRNASQEARITTTNGMPTVHIAGSTFLTNVVLVPKGESLVLVEDDSVEHIIQNGTWTPSGLPLPHIEPGAPIVHSLDLKGGSAEVGPITIAGVFHLYCTIHQGMSLTVVVQ